MSQINVNIRMDEDLKKQFERLLDEMGLTMTGAFNIFAKTVVREKRIPFEISAINYNNAYDKIKEINNIDFNNDAFGEELLDD
ncbi:MAG: type II toxin-antitoxin system RelB/DinJ family antitoxin [Erysipelotrichaceae bacterium]|nr:type II toxin-antitoxin system RelB/DinJ family antitoxin [Erysipelotrichaceae bacterium]